MWGPYHIIGLALSLIGLVVSIIAIRGDPSRGRARCPKCWYPADPARTLTCPECGHTARSTRALHRCRRRKRYIVAALLLTAIGQFGWLEDRIRRGGWIAAVPTEAMILGLPWLPDDWISGTWPRRFSEDWSLFGRARDMPDWQFNWARARFESRVLDTRNTSDASRGYVNCSRLVGRRAGLRRATLSSEMYLHCLNLVTTETGSSAPKNQLMYMLASDLADAYDTLPQTDQANVTAGIDRLRPELLSLRAGRSGADHVICIQLLGLGNPTPEVLNAIEQAAGGSPDAPADALVALSRLIRHDDSVRFRILRLLKTHRSFLNLRRPRDSVVNAAFAMMTAHYSSDEVAELLMLLANTSEGQHRALDVAFRTVRAEPSLARDLTDPILACDQALAYRANDALRMARTDDRRLQKLGREILTRIVFGPGFTTPESAPIALAAMDTALADPTWTGSLRDRVSELADRLRERVPAQSP